MKRIFTSAVISFLFIAIIFGQKDKYTEKLEKLLKNEYYKEIIDFKKNKASAFESRALFIKGLAHYQTKDDRNAVKFFNMAISKGPVDDTMYFYNSIALYYLDKYDEALRNIDSAISYNPSNSDFYSVKGEIYNKKEEPDSASMCFNRAIEQDSSNIGAYISLIEIHKEQKDFEMAIEIANAGLKKLMVNEKSHQSLSFNLGLIYQLSGNYIMAKSAFEEHSKNYPKDYPAIAKLIQISYSLKEYDIVAFLKWKIYDAHESGNLPQAMKEMFCFNQFLWNEKTVFGFELYEPVPNDYADCKYKYMIIGNESDVDFKIRMERDTLSSDSSYVFKMIKNDTLFSFSNFSVNKDLHYPKLDSIVLGILNEDIKPIGILANYEMHINKLKAKNSSLNGLENNGSSYEKAVVVNSISEEYKWLHQYYPGHSVNFQALLFHKKKPYDKLNINTADGKTIDVYFDISKFFGKGF